VRGIVNHAFELIWNAELDQRRIPSQWISTWKYNQEHRIEDLQTAFPQRRQRVRLLQLMTERMPDPVRTPLSEGGEAQSASDAVSVMAGSAIAQG
jgi:hypothetical protein